MSWTLTTFRIRLLNNPLLMAVRSARGRFQHQRQLRRAEILLQTVMSEANRQPDKPEHLARVEQPRWRLVSHTAALTATL